MFQIKALQISRERATQVYVSGLDINVKYHFHAGSWQPFNANKCLETRKDCRIHEKFDVVDKRAWKCV